MRLECPRCHTFYVDPSPAAEVEPIGCPWCGHTTAAPRPSPFVTTESLEAAMAAMKALGPPLPEIEFFEAFGEVVVVARRGNEREPLGRMSREAFEALKARLKETP